MKNSGWDIHGVLVFYPQVRLAELVRFYTIEIGLLLLLLLLLSYSCCRETLYKAKDQIA
jgi:hypothetical protein